MNYHYIVLPLVSFLAMAAQDILGVGLVRAEVRKNYWSAGNWDAAQDAFRMAWLYCGGDALFVSRNFLLSALVIGATLLADKIGTWLGGVVSDKVEAKEDRNGSASLLQEP